MKRKIEKILLIFISLLMVGLGTGYFYAVSLLEPVNAAANEEISVTIPKGSTTNNIAQILKEKDLIKHELAFQVYVKYQNLGAKLKAGNYQLSQRMDVAEITTILAKGNIFIDSVKFMIPEGYNVKQIAEKLSKEGIVNKERFLQLVKEGNFDFAFIKQIPNDNNMEYKLEGYLFPETYEIRKGATEEEVIAKMLSQFEKEWNPEWNKVMTEKNMSMHQLVTLASIIEREVIVDKERPIVAGVFYNRLRDSWSLQSCATVQFILGKQKENLTFADLEIVDPYNTYINQGLPPGPIGNPGRTSLDAAVHPATHDYFFFVTKKDQSGEHYFSKTFAEHQKYDAKSRGNW